MNGVILQQNGSAITAETVGPLSDFVSRENWVAIDRMIKGLIDIDPSALLLQRGGQAGEDPESAWNQLPRAKMLSGENLDQGLGAYRAWIDKYVKADQQRALVVLLGMEQAEKSLIDQTVDLGSAAYWLARVARRWGTSVQQLILDATRPMVDAEKCGEQRKLLGKFGATS